MAQPNELLKYLNQTVPCYATMIYSENGIWKGTNPLVDVIPLFIIQLTIAILVTRLFLLVFKPFQQPRFIAEVIGGMFLGPSGLGRFESFTNKFFPNGSFVVLDPMSHFALVHYAFLAGLEMDLTTIPATGKKVLIVAVAGIIIPLAIGLGLSFMFGQQAETKVVFIFWATTLTVTGYSALFRLLDNLKILDTNVAKMALASAQINEVSSWVLLALAISLSGKLSATHWSMICTVAFVLFCFYFLRPAMLWLIRQTPEGEGHNEFHLCCFLAGVGICGVLTDACGTHPIIGAFVFGLIVPRGKLEGKLVERMEEFVTGLLLPIFFVACGHRADFGAIVSNSSWAKVALVLLLACSAKVLSTLFGCLLCGMSFQEAIPLGILMNTKSLLAMVILHIGVEQKSLTTQTYTIMVIAVLAMTIIVTPIMIASQPEKNFEPYKRRTIQRAKPSEDLRILACVHGIRNVPAIVNLLQASNATRESQIHVFTLQLVELIGRASAMHVVTLSRKTKTASKNPSDLETDQIITTFENYARRHDFTTVQPLIVRSAYSTMDEDICSVAEEKRAAFIILPFHKQQSVVGEMEDIKPAIRDVNENVLANAPCSVGILIDRGLADSGDFSGRVAVLYFGGPDDREALSYAWRMANHPDVSLRVVRFLPGGNPVAMESESMDFMPNTQEFLAVEIENAREKQSDEAYLNRFRRMTQADSSIQYSEMVIDDVEETVKAIKSMDSGFDLYVVGRRIGVSSSLTAGLADWCDYPELGAVGDVLATSKFSSAFSVLVVQQYTMLGRSKSIASSGTTTSSMNHREGIEGMEWRPSVGEGGSFPSFVNRRGTTHGY